MHELECIHDVCNAPAEIRLHAMSMELLDCLRNMYLQAFCWSCAGEVMVGPKQVYLLDEPTTGKTQLHTV